MFVKFLITFFTYILCANAIKVCSDFKYFYQPFSDHCYDNPSNTWNITQIIQSWGFTAEEHYVVTDDGYRLLASRGYSNISQNTPILLGPGFHLNSLIYAVRGNTSLAYILGNLGYDVWIINNRGTKYSRGHVNLTTDDNEYWQFSINELAIYDLRSILNLVYKTTNQAAIYIGISAGTTVSYVYALTFPEEAKQKLQGIISYSPIGYFDPDPRSSWNLIPPVFPLIRSFVYLFFHGENLKYPLNAFFKPFAYTPGLMYTAQTILNTLTGWDYNQMDPLTLPLFLQQVVDSYGIDVVGHFVQIQKSGKFQNYDYGTTKNMIIYGESTPPLYNLSQISVPVTLFIGENDFIAPKELALKTYSELSESVQCGFNIVNNTKWTHLDFLQGRDLTEFLYNNVINVIQNMESGMCV